MYGLAINSDKELEVGNTEIGATVTKPKIGVQREGKPKRAILKSFYLRLHLRVRWEISS